MTRDEAKDPEILDAIVLEHRLDPSMIDLRRACHADWIAQRHGVVRRGFSDSSMVAPIQGAMIQQGIDAAAVLNALRSIEPGRKSPA